MDYLSLCLRMTTKDWMLFMLLRLILNLIICAYTVLQHEFCDVASECVLLNYQGSHRLLKVFNF